MSGYAGGGGSITINTSSITGGSDGDILYNNGGVVGGFQIYDDTGAGNGAFALRKTMSGSSATSNFFSVTGTFPAAAITTDISGVLVNSTGAAITDATGTKFISAFRSNLAAGITAAVDTYTGTFINSSAGVNTNNTRLGTLLGADGNHGLFGASFGATSTGWNIGVEGASSDGDLGIGVLGKTATPGFNNIDVVGVMGLGYSTATGSTRIGGYFATAAPPNAGSYGTSAALVADNRANTDDIFQARDNGATPSTTASWAGMRVQDGGQPQNGLGVLTSATMTPETAGELRTTISSYTWTNAQVAALPASAGDISVCTLPAKTQVRNAYVVITGAAAGPTTVTVSLGDAIAGTPFINYVIASDAKAAANTVYGDAVAERGTSLDTEFYYVPSYTATTLVTCHFISTGGALSTVTGSTGRVILETVLLP